MNYTFVITHLSCLNLNLSAIISQFNILNVKLDIYIFSQVYFYHDSLREWCRLGLNRKPISIFFCQIFIEKERGGGGDATVRWSDEIAFHGWTVGLFAARQATALQCCSLVDNDKPLLETCPRKIAEPNSTLFLQNKSSDREKKNDSPNQLF